MSQSFGRINSHRMLVLWLILYDVLDKSYILYDVLDKSYKLNYEPALLNEEIPDESTENDTIPSLLVISTRYVGNVARFMNHSCNPNVFWHLVQYEHNRESFLHVAFFAMKHIPPLTELTYDYGISRFETHKRRKCLCGSEKCRGYFG